MNNEKYIINNHTSVYYYIIEKDFENVRLLSERLNSDKFICLGVSPNVKDFSIILSEMLIKPSLVFVRVNNVTRMELDQIGFLAKFQSFRVILFNDNISGYSNAYGMFCVLILNK
jgi:hypothetical protein